MRMSHYSRVLSVVRWLGLSWSRAAETKTVRTRWRPWPRPRQRPSTPRPRPRLHVYQLSLLSGGNGYWPRRMLPLVSHSEYADGTDRRTPDRYITLSAKRVSSVVRCIVVLMTSWPRRWKYCLETVSRRERVSRYFLFLKRISLMVSRQSHFNKFACMCVMCWCRSDDGQFRRSSAADRRFWATTRAGRQ